MQGTLNCPRTNNPLGVRALPNNIVMSICGQNLGSVSNRLRRELPILA